MIIHDENEMMALGAELARQAKAGDVFLLEGDLGAGKTTFVRGFLRELGHLGKVKSPTYTLVESYDCANFSVNHFDLYRLLSQNQLHEIGFQDYLATNAVCLIEWPDLAKSLISKSKTIRIEFCAAGRDVSIV